MQNKNNIDNSIESIKESLVNLSILDIQKLGELLAKDLGYDTLSSMLSAFSGSGTSKESDSQEEEKSEDKKYRVIFKKLKEGQTAAAVKKIKEYYNIGLADAKNKTNAEFVIVDGCEESTKVTIMQEWGDFAELEEKVL